MSKQDNNLQLLLAAATIAICIGIVPFVVLLMFLQLTQ